MTNYGRHRLRIVNLRRQPIKAKPGKPVQTDRQYARRERTGILQDIAVRTYQAEFERRLQREMDLLPAVLNTITKHLAGEGFAA
ncbi:MAG: hypothetical protein JWN75_148 [Candidatus Saccharibacteria bacterium]|nr:hypothetical protein [Candidatus Saccharibacteria bacterium]